MPVTVEAAKQHLSRVTQAQDSVQQASKWILRHSDDIEPIVDAWSQVYKSANDSLKVALIYVMNDAVQYAKSAKSENVIMTFHPFIVNSIVGASDKVKKALSRCLDILRDRHIYPQHVIDEMITAMNSDIYFDGGAVPQQIDISEFDIGIYCGKLQTYKEACEAIDRARTILDNINFDLENYAEKIKTKSGVIQMETEVELMIQKLEKFAQRIGTQSSRTAKMRELTTVAGHYFANQVKDVGVVSEAYSKFAKGIESTRNIMDHFIKTGTMPPLNAEGEMEPPINAPSPTPDDDPFKHMDSDDDMDMDDDEQPATAPSALIPAKDYIPTLQGIAGTPSTSALANNNGSSSQAGTPTSAYDPRRSRFDGDYPQPPSLPPGLVDILPKNIPISLPTPSKAPVPFSPPKPVPYTPTNPTMVMGTPNPRPTYMTPTMAVPPGMEDMDFRKSDIPDVGGYLPTPYVPQDPATPTNSNGGRRRSRWSTESNDEPKSKRQSGFGAFPR